MQIDLSQGLIHMICKVRALILSMFQCSLFTGACGCIYALTHWGQVTHTCVGNLTIIGSDHGLSPGRCRAITWTNVGILLIGPLGTNFSEMLIEIHTFSFKKIHLTMSSGKWQPFCLGLNVLMNWFIGLGNGLSPLQCQTFTKANTDILTFGNNLT